MENFNENQTPTYNLLLELTAFHKQNDNLILLYDFIFNSEFTYKWKAQQLEYVDLHRGVEGDCYYFFKILKIQAVKEANRVIHFISLSTL